MANGYGNSWRSGLKQAVAPALEPVTPAEAKSHANITSSADDTLIGYYITAARRAVEQYTGRALIHQDWDYVQDDATDPVSLPLPPLVSATPYYTDLSDVEHAEDSTIYIVDTSVEPGRLFTKSSNIWSTTRGLSGFRVRFRAGYGATAADVPEDLKTAIKEIVTFLYEHRGDDSVQKAFTDETADSLVRLVPVAAMFCAPYRTAGRLLA